MLRSRKNAGKFHTRCYYGCCHDWKSNKVERRWIRRQENREWKKEMKNDY
jgi:hypothetical protein